MFVKKLTSKQLAFSVALLPILYFFVLWLSLKQPFYISENYKLLLWSIVFPLLIVTYWILLFYSKKNRPSIWAKIKRKNENTSNAAIAVKLLFASTLFFSVVTWSLESFPAFPTKYFSLERFEANLLIVKIEDNGRLSKGTTKLLVKNINSQREIRLVLPKKNQNDFSEGETIAVEGKKSWFGNYIEKLR